MTVGGVVAEHPYPVPLTAAITPKANNESSSPTPVFEFSAYSSTVTVPDGLYYQLDAWQGAWTQVKGSNPYSGTVALMQPGFHILYAYATDGQEATSTQALLRSVAKICERTIFPRKRF